LTVEDLELTLTYELLQHEKMTSLCRRLMSQLAQEQDAMGRRLDELMMVAMAASAADFSVDVDKALVDDDEDYRLSVVSKEEECRQLYMATSRELYRKQILAQRLFDSIDDSTLSLYYYSDHLGEDSDDATRLPSTDDDAGLATATTANESPRRVARKCADQWSRDCKKSELFEYSTLLKRLVEDSNGGGLSTIGSDRNGINGLSEIECQPI